MSVERLIGWHVRQTDGAVLILRQGRALDAPVAVLTELPAGTTCRLIGDDLVCTHADHPPVRIGPDGTISTQRPA